MTVPFEAPITSEEISKCGPPEYKLVEVDTGTEVFPGILEFIDPESDPELSGIFDDPSLTD